MGRLLSIVPCPVCNYNVEDELHHGTSAISGEFIKNGFKLAICHDCRQLVSVLVMNDDAETDSALRDARYEIVQMEADAVIGDDRAKDLLPLFRHTLDTFNSAEEPAAVTVCTNCGSNNIEVHGEVTADQFDAQDAWLPCPRCEEGRLMVETTGRWD
jgi:uncharacterized protein with PIN domain